MQTLAALEADLERGVTRATLSGKRLAYAGAIGGTVATVATVAALIAREPSTTPYWLSEPACAAKCHLTRFDRRISGFSMRRNDA